MVGIFGTRTSVLRYLIMFLVTFPLTVLLYDFLKYKTTKETIPNPRFDNTEHKRMKSTKMDEFIPAMGTRRSERNTHFKQKCQSFGYNVSPSSEQIVVWRLPQYNLSWKSVPKIGSSFLIQVFQTLKNDKDVFSKSRKKLHSKNHSEEEKRAYRLQELQNDTVLIFARNPYSRLLSGYIDKVYLPNALKLQRQIFERKASLTSNKIDNNQCIFNNTFDDFVKFALDESLYHQMFGHYGPVLKRENLNLFCRLPNKLIVKQESFSEDIEYALRLGGVEKQKFDIVYAAMHGKNVQSNIPGIVKTVYGRMSNKVNLVNDDNCLSWSNIAERLWTSFQIQGYIRESAKFPHQKYSSKEQYKDSDYLISLILRESEQNPLTHEQKVKQRTKALLKAYSTISKTTMDKIKQQFSKDFSFYDYSKDLEDVNK